MAAILVALLLAPIRALLAIARLVLLRWERMDWFNAPRPGKVVKVDGVRLHFVEDGRGPAVILVHGFGGHTFSFRHTLPALAKRFRAIAVDLKGFGFSEKPNGGDYSLTEQARLVLRLMDELNIQSASIIGHSMGGEVALRMAAAAPERVDRLVLAASVSGTRIWTPPPMRQLRGLFAVLARLAARRFFERMFYDPANATEESLRGYGEPTHIKGYGDALFELATDSRRDARIDYASISAPVLILWAEAERILPGFVLNRLRKNLPDGRVISISKAGHLLLEERPQECNKAILDFLTGTQDTELEKPLSTVRSRGLAT